MDGRKILNLAMLGAVPLLGLLVWYGNQQQDEVQALLPSAPSIDDISYITVDWKDKHREFVREQGRWMIRAPLQIAANPVQVDKMLELLRVNSLKSFAIDKGELDKFGFGSMNLKVTLGTESVAFGTTEPLHSRRYVSHQGRVHIIDRDIHFLYNLPLERYISLNLLPADSRPVAIHVLDGTLALVDGKWVFQDIDSSAGADQITAFIDDWKHGSALEISSFHGGEGKEIRIDADHLQQPLTFLLQQDDSEYRLARTDLNIQYHLPKDVGDRLFYLDRIKDRSLNAGAPTTE